MSVKGTLVLLLVVAGCGGQQDEAGWTRASEALGGHGVAAYRASATANGQQVQLRDGAGATIGQLELVQAEASSTVSLEFRADSWKQVVLAAEGKMTLSLDGREATLRWDGSLWTGDAAAMALLEASQPYADFVRLVGSEAQLGIGVPMAMASSAPAPADTPTPVNADMSGVKPAPTLCCGDVVTTGSGWAWYWEANAQATACKRAADTLKTTCLVSSGYDCCNASTAKTACTACVNWGTGWACSTAGYLQYAAPSGGKCF
jgi:hypothetical protein